ncbi:MAG TPA: von Willebrand factor type A domain-containing protein [Flavitalea sp.]|nr:von Willebrand factor type A domain-containing protein [Flavitalea sp.]
MKTFAAICFALVLFSSAPAQFYLRGEIKDEKNTPLPNAKIVLHSNGYLYYSGSSGGFGIPTPKPYDSITVSVDGYVSYSTRIDAARFHSIILKILYSSANVQKNRLLSFTRDFRMEDPARLDAGMETYSALVENEFVTAKKYPETGFAIHTDRASYSNIRRFLNMNTEVPPDAVRTEELLNYFNFGYTSPPRDSVFGFTSQISDCPWNPEAQLLFVQMNARKIDSSKIPPSNLVFLIDVSGSMDMPNRLPLLKAAFKLLVDNLREKDTVSIVVYGSTIGVWLKPTSGKEKVKIRKSIEDLNPGGSTPGESGIRSAYRLAKSQFIRNGNNRVILATDGDFNVGQSSEEDLEKLITYHQQSGIYLTCLGVGMGNYKDSKLEVLAKKGNGNFAYLDNEQEAEKVLVKELTQTLYTVADDAYLSIRFNPRLIKEYRLIGFDNKRKAIADTLSEVEGGEVGSGHSMLALFECIPAPDRREDLIDGETVADITVHYSLPGDSVRKQSGYRATFSYLPFDELSDCYRFASSVAMYASLLKNSKNVRRLSWSDVQFLASRSYNKEDSLQKEFLVMVDKAKKIYAKNRGRRSRQ